jgi:hypothetical protein
MADALNCAHPAPGAASRACRPPQSDFVMAVDHACLLDARHLVADTARFSAVHMNHSRVRGAGRGLASFDSTHRGVHLPAVAADSAHQVSKRTPAVSPQHAHMHARRCGPTSLATTIAQRGPSPSLPHATSHRVRSCCLTTGPTTGGAGSTWSCPEWQLNWLPSQ